MADVLGAKGAVGSAQHPNLAGPRIHRVAGAGEDDPGYAQLALRNSIDRGLIRGPRMVSAGIFVSVNGGHGDADVLAPDQQLARRPNIADTVDDVSRAVRRDIKYGADWIKLMTTGGVMDPLSDYRVGELSEE
jgi:imidazolonepropionase-like amidohydrolase